MSEELKVQRTREQWSKCEPKMMAKMSESAVVYALQDAQRDIAALYRWIDQLASTGGEAVEVAGYACPHQLKAMQCDTSASCAIWNSPGRPSSSMANREPLMTVAQHKCIVAAMQPGPAGVVVDREWTEFLSELHSHLDNIAEFDPSYPGDTMPRNTSAELLVALRALLNQAGGE